MLQVDTTDTVAPDSRLQDVLQALAAPPPGVDMVVLPELWLPGAFNAANFADLAEPVDGPLSVALGQAAAATGVWLHAGSIVEVDADALFNTSLLFTPGGELAGRYRKIHLFGFGSGESDLLTGGEQVVVVDTPLGKTGLSTCYDLRFPELYRAQRELGAAAYLVPSGWPAARVGAWRSLATARAVENQAVFVGANAVGRSGDVQLGGESVVVSPDGTELAVGPSETPGWVVAQVDPGQAHAARDQFPTYADRRIR
ncbi:MAG: carbon-nitrogen family hydrolase [Actinomycetia bacterium]|nr:carbon-nitrogen family hydrolase [Actinomycetes bacterium]